MEIPAFDESKWIPPKRAFVDPYQRKPRKNGWSWYLTVTIGWYDGYRRDRVIKGNSIHDVQHNTALFLLKSPKERAVDWYYSTKLSGYGAGGQKPNGSFIKCLTITCLKHSTVEGVTLSGRNIAEFNELLDRLNEPASGRIRPPERRKKYIALGAVNPGGCSAEDFYSYVWSWKRATR